MSHHLDSPIARQDIRLDTTDLYVFRGEVGTVLVINVCHSIAGAVRSPGFHPEGMYEFKIDLDGDAVEEIVSHQIRRARARGLGSRGAFLSSVGRVMVPQETCSGVSHAVRPA